METNTNVEIFGEKMPVKITYSLDEGFVQVVECVATLDVAPLISDRELEKIELEISNDRFTDKMG